MTPLGLPHVHLATTESTNNRARTLAACGAPHGTIVTAGEQTAGRGRRGRSWETPPGQALLLSVVLRDVPPLLTLRAGLAVAETCGTTALLKWPNDVVVADRKVAGILCEQITGEDWAIVGIGVNVAVELELLPAEFRQSAGTLGLPTAEIVPWRSRLLEEFERTLRLGNTEMLAAWTRRDYLLGREVTWNEGGGVATGIDNDGHLLVATDHGEIALDSGEVSLARFS